MSDFIDIKAGLENYNQLTREADQARAYIKITDEQGPSEQLLQFVDYDGQLFKEMGLESLGLENMSLATRHEVFKSKLNPDAIDQMAMEGLGDVIRKYHGWLIAGGVLASVLVPGSSIGGIAVAAIVSGLIGMKLESDLAKLGAFPYNDYSGLLRELSNVIKADDEITARMPSGFGVEEWESYNAIYSEKSAKLEAIRKSVDGKQVKKEPFGKSGWDLDKFKTETKHLLEVSKEIEASKNKLAAHFDKIDQYVKSAHTDDEKKIVGLISASVGFSHDAFQASINMAHLLKDYLNEVAKAFEANGKPTE